MLAKKNTHTHTNTHTLTCAHTHTHTHTHTHSLTHSLTHTHTHTHTNTNTHTQTQTHTHKPNTRDPEYSLLPEIRTPVQQNPKQVLIFCRFVELLDPRGPNVVGSARGGVYLCHCLQLLLQTNILACCQERFQAKRTKAVSTFFLDLGLSSLQLFRSRYLELWWWLWWWWWLKLLLCQSAVIIHGLPPPDDRIGSILFYTKSL